MKLFSAILLLLLTGCASQPKNTLMQISTIDALLTGAYDGQMASGELLRYGNLGIGTFDRLEGEMIVIDRKIYQACADGLVREMPDSATTPFATVVNFESDQTLELNTPLTAEALRTKADALAPEKNLFLALRIDGTFSAIKVRSVPKQKKPYPPLVDVAKNQAVFEYTNITGTVLGFRSPDFVKGVNVTGYHLHFISSDRKSGGHILDFAVRSGTLKLDTCNRFYMVLPEDKQFSTLDLSKDRSKELERVEK